MATSTSRQIAEMLEQALATSDPAAIRRLRTVIVDYERAFPKSSEWIEKQPLLYGIWQAMKYGRAS